MSKYYCFKCGDPGPPVTIDETRTLGLCGCQEYWSVGTVNQLCDYLNELHEIMEVIGLLENGIEPNEEMGDDTN